VSDRVQDTLRRADERDFASYKDELRKLERQSVRDADPDEDFTSLRGELCRSDAGYPLGPGFPAGSSLRSDGQSHREAWMEIVRADPCSYCGKRTGGTVDHIEPRSKGGRDTHAWINYTAACPSCNVSKGDTLLLLWLRHRRVLTLSADAGRAGRTPAKHRRLERERQAGLREAA
jgi:5-methylcytosine-specific restriction endonuclease McrA